MDWNAFIAAIAWVLTVISALILFVAICVTADDEPLTPVGKRRLIATLVISLVCLTLGIATIAGMGWA